MRLFPVLALWVPPLFVLSASLAPLPARAVGERPESGPFAQFKGQAQVRYPSPSATAVTDQAAHLAGIITPGPQGGVLSLDLGAEPGEMLLGIVQQTLAPSSDDVRLTIDSANLVPGTAYRWRFRLVAADGTTVKGEDQTFTTLPGDVSLAFGASPGGEAHANPVRASYPPGTQVSVTAMPYAGFHFVRWDLDGEPAGSANPLLLTLNHSHVLSPSFAPEVSDAGLPAAGHASPSGGCSTGKGPGFWLALLVVPWLARRGQAAGRG